LRWGHRFHHSLHRGFAQNHETQDVLCIGCVTAGEERERNPRNSRRAGTGTRERNGRGRGGDAVEGQGAAGDATFRDSDGGATRADLAR
jgi:hypothetical protein